jgi:hypothetical protein
VLALGKEQMPCPSGPRWAIACSIDSIVSVESMRSAFATHPAIPHIPILDSLFCPLFALAVA